MKPKIFIDGSEGTTGLKIFSRFEKRDDIKVMSIDPEKRKDINERRRLINESDITFLCLPDEAARESAAMVENENVTIIDTSTAHRTAAGWCYGFPELSGQHRQDIATGKRIAVPGCHATGFIALVYPLISAGFLKQDYPLSIHSLSGYSGGGKPVIAAYENETRATEYDAPRLYALTQQHKHLPEMTKICRLQHEPLFSPVIADYFAGMVVSVPLYASAFTSRLSLRELCSFYHEYYSGAKLVFIADEERGFLPANQMAGRDDLAIYLTGNDERMVLCASFDNLGKGASGAAVQCMNIVLRCKENKGLVCGE
ncbi:MAG: N-acetyl-gamma-glutamyl-phosphate reductase [Lachnospiraceae bacterium]|jgi:N-acetyl-gamma-glutamyl-phosphate reductase|nr:N-acetyl-gamma-glutamyl-phosphate reductase [Lachnospiraceae bacterium]